MVLPQAYKREYKGGLLPDFVYQNLLAPELLEGYKDESVGNCYKEQGVHEDEGDPEDVVVNGYL